MNLIKIYNINLRFNLQMYQSLVKLRKEPSISHGEYDIKAFSDSTLYVIRSLSTFDTLTLVFNVGMEPDTVHLDRVAHLTLPAVVYDSSIHSTRLPGYVCVHRLVSQLLTYRILCCYYIVIQIYL